MATTIIGIFRRDGEPDHLADTKALAAWLAEQPANDDLGLQEAMIRLHVLTPMLPAAPGRRW